MRRIAGDPEPGRRPIQPSTKAVPLAFATLLPLCGPVSAQPPAEAPPRRNELAVARPATHLRIRAVENEGTTGQVEVHLDSGAPVVTVLTGKAEFPTVFDREAPPGATTIEVVARLTIRMADGTREKHEVRKAFRIVGSSGPVFGGAGAFDPVAAYREFLSLEGLDTRFFEAPRPEPEAAIVAAEKRLGFRLDPDHRALLARLGPIRADDFFMTEPSRLDTSIRQLETLWGDAPQRADGLPANVRALLGRSTMVLVAAGDGYTALLWEKGEPGAAWRLGQDSYTPKRLDDESGNPLSLRAALGKTLSRLADLYLPSNGRTPRIGVQPRKANAFVLTIDRFGGELVLDLVPE